MSDSAASSRRARPGAPRSLVDQVARGRLRRTIALVSTVALLSTVVVTGLVTTPVSAAPVAQVAAPVRAAVAAPAAALPAAAVPATAPVPATVPGQPGTPQQPTQVYLEDFENTQQTPNPVPTLLSNYTGGAAAKNETYTADPVWLSDCNGFVAAAQDNAVVTNATKKALGCLPNDPGADFFAASGIFDYGLSAYVRGESDAQAQQNHALSAYTQDPTIQTGGTPHNYAGMEFKTKSPIAVTAGHYYSFGVDAGVRNCNASHPLLAFYLLADDGSKVPAFSSPIDPCTGTVYSNMTGARFIANAPVLYSGTSLGIEMDNQQSSGNGNDGGIDNIQLLDTTPQLDKAFSPGTIQQGDNASLTFTVTNTTDLDAKNGWSFTDNLPTRLLATGTNTTTCPNATVAAGADATAVAVTGDLNAGQASCTVTVQVTTNTPGSYTNNSSNISTLVGLNPPGASTLTVSEVNQLTANKTITSITDTDGNGQNDAGDVIGYQIVAKNTGLTSLSAVTVTDQLANPAGPALDLTCTPSQGSTLAPGDSVTCTGAYTITQADVDSGRVDNTAFASGTSPQGAAVRSNDSSTHTPTGQTAGLTIAKTADPAAVTAAGQNVTYTFVVTNTGVLTLSDVNIVDAFTSGGTGTKGPIDCMTRTNPTASCSGNSVTLAPKQQATFTATYTTNQADIEKGTIANTATVAGSPPSGSPVTATDSAVVAVTQAPNLSIVKSPTAPTFNKAGDIIGYDFVVTNTGNLTLTGLAVQDSQDAPAVALDSPGVTCPDTTLDPGQVTTCTAKYTARQADVDAGQVTDRATAAGFTLAGTRVPSLVSIAKVTAAPAPAMTIQKTAAPDTFNSVGQKLTYSFEVTNTGNVTVSNLQIVDQQAAPAGDLDAPGVTCPVSTLLPGDATTCTAQYTITQVDLDHGTVNNSAYAEATPPGSTTPFKSPSSDVSVPVAQSPALSLVKAAPQTHFSQAGTVIPYTFTVTNTGNQTVHGISVSDTQIHPAAPLISQPSCGVTTLAPGDSVVCTASYTVTQDDVDYGSLNDFAVASGLTPSNATISSNRSDVSIPASPLVGLTVVKYADESSFNQAGDAIDYHFLITNVGSATMRNISVADTQLDPAGNLNPPGVSCPSQEDLSPNSSFECTASYTVTPADVTHGSVTDSATATGTPSGEPDQPFTTPPVQLTVPLAALKVEKSSVQETFSTAGDVLDYQFKVTNTGQTPLSNIAVTDVQQAPATPPTLTPDCLVTTLPAGASTTCTADYPVTQADLDLGSVTDTATAHGTTADGTPIDSAPSSLTVPGTRTPDLEIRKEADTEGLYGPNQRIRYLFRVYNTGNVTLTNIFVTDTQIAPAGPLVAAPVCATSEGDPLVALEPGQEADCMAEYFTTQADVDKGEVDDFATATGTTPDGSTKTSLPSDTVIVPIRQNLNISVLKYAQELSYAVVGNVLHYNFEITNSGNVTLEGIRLVDQPLFNSRPVTDLKCPVVAALEPGDTIVCSASYTIDQADLDRGSVEDVATAYGTPPGSTEIASDPSNNTVTAKQGPALSIVKTPEAPASYAKPGDMITYDFLVSNVGNVTVKGISVSDPQDDPAGPVVPVDPPCATTLGVGETTTCKATYKVTQDDIDNGFVRDVATATGSTPEGAPVVTPPSILVVKADLQPKLTLAKIPTPDHFAAPGTPIGYQFVVTNDGNLTMQNISVTDAPESPAGPVAVTCSQDPLPPGQSVTCTGSYTTSQDDLNHGQVSDTAVAHGTPLASQTVTDSNAATATVTGTQVAKLTLLKTAATPTYANVDDVITYYFDVKNSGNVTLQNVSVADTQDDGDQLPAAPSCQPGSVLPGDTVRCTATWQVTQADLDRGSINDHATASATRIDSPATVTSNESSASVPAMQGPALSLTKTPLPSTVSAVGDVVTYTFAVQNTGNVTLHGLSVVDTPTDPAGGVSVTCPPGDLAPDGVATCSGTYPVTQDDLDHGRIDDRAAATAFAPGATTPTSSNEALATVDVTQTPGLRLTKTPSVTSFDAPDTAIDYEFDVTNDGNVTMHDISVTDAPVSPAGSVSVSCPLGDVKPTITVICHGSYQTSQEDLDHGQVSDTATAYGFAPASTTQTRSNDASANVLGTQRATLDLVKSADPTTFAIEGALITYSFLVTNTGNVTLKDVSVVDTQDDGAGQLPVAPSCSPGPLLPLATVTCKATFQTTQADLDRGSINDHATASAARIDSPKTVTSNVSAASVGAQQVPSLSLTKVPSVSTVSALGAVVDYSFVLKNTGNVTLHGISVVDSPNPPAGPVPVKCPPFDLEPGVFEACQGSYTVTQKDLDHGQIADLATVSAFAPGATKPTTATGSAVVKVVQHPVLTLTKTPSRKTFDAAGVPIDYDFVVTNGGNVTMHGITVGDSAKSPATDVRVSCPPGDVAPGKSVTCTGSYQTSQADLDHGQVVDTAIAHGFAPGSDQATPSNAASATVLGTERPALELAKRANPAQFAVAGVSITYSFAVTNSGNVTLQHISVVDSQEDGAGQLPVDPSCPSGPLAPGHTVTCTATWITTQADVDRGSINDRAIAFGDPPGSTDPVSSNPSSVSVQAPQAPSLSVVKTAVESSYARAGEVIDYRFVVSNTGNVPVSHVVVTDVQAAPAGKLTTGPICPDTAVAVGESLTCTGGYRVSQADVDNGRVADSATATGQDPKGAPVPPSPPSVLVVPSTPRPGLSVVKTAHPEDTDSSGEVTQGDQIGYSFLVTNTGNVSLSGVAVHDAMIGAVSCPSPVLAPGLSQTCTANAAHTITAADVAVGVVHNAATASAVTSCPDQTSGLRMSTGINSTVQTAVGGLGCPPVVTVLSNQSTTDTPVAPLAYTGAPITKMTMWAALATLLGMGFLITGRRRRRPTTN